ncbi:AraC family transcriptional regulator [Bremerella sp. T1]|uniref:AraC family transcriptional regulator n=1 Tax=Bremerella sp. TYQ1 TaxID=3119568 RepID=UPI001CCC5A59|nr:XylR family transcriptional regulator [Bremerella volcania]UBM35445.1 XylR family transcriptional regulator [Bremerella volcania]
MNDDKSLLVDELPHVAILVDTSTEWGRRLIRGVTSYVDKQGPWRLWIEPRGQDEPFHLPAGFAGDGVIARISTPSLAEELSQAGMPVINISGIELSGNQFPCVTTDYEATAKLAAEHFLDRGFREFAYVGPLKRPYVRDHAARFRQAVEASCQGAPCRMFNYVPASMTRSSWGGRMQMLGEWLADLPKPIGIFTWATSAGAQVLDVCRQRDIIVPDEVAVLAGDDDELLCTATTPPMSGVLVSSEQIGHRAAERLDTLMRGGVDEAGTEQIGPIQINTRHSTEALAIDDPELSRVVRYIRSHAYETGLTVAEVSEATLVTRRVLERKFQEVFGRTPLTEIRRLRMARVRDLLVMTDLPMSKIAAMSGFGTPEYMTNVFRGEYGIAPLKYRSRTRAR